MSNKPNSAVLLCELEID